MSALFSVNTYAMKRFLFTAVLIVAIVGVMLYFTPRSMQTDVFSYARYNPTVSVYCRETKSNAIDLGLGRQVTCSLCDYKETLAECSGVDGVSFTFCGTPDDVADVVSRLRAQPVCSQAFDGLTVACYYSPLIRQCVTIDGRSVNVQIACRDGVVTVGYPLILGSY